MMRVLAAVCICIFVVAAILIVLYDAHTDRTKDEIDHGKD